MTAYTLAELDALPCWKVKHVGSYLGVSVSTVLRLPIPRVEMHTSMGTGRKPIVSYDPDEVKAYRRAHLSHTVREGK